MMMNTRSSSFAAALLIALTAALAPSVDAQQWNERIPGNAGEWSVQMLRPSGQPVVPIFDGWYAEPDGTASLCLGYFNLNFDEALEIPVGPNNYIEPERFNGLQPTYFNPVPMRAGNKQRHYCVFTINVPQGSEEQIVWHLGRDYKDYSVPASSTSIEYRVDDIFFSSDRAERGGSMAPFVTFVDPPGPEGIGKGARGGKKLGPLTAKVGQPVTLTLGVRQPRVDEFVELADYEGGERTFEVTWQKYSGPPDMVGIVKFSENVIRVGPVEGTATTAATFTEPGEYVLLAQVLGGGYDNQCCWTNAYVEVTVAP
jgi:hypothetical protein